MLIQDIFETSIEEKIEPVIKVGERHNESKLSTEIGSYVVTPTLEKYIDDFLEHYTNTIRVDTGEVGVWISGYFGSGKSHLAKILSLLAENPPLLGIPAAKRFESRLPSQADRRNSILRSLAQLNYCDTRVLAFNINSLADSKRTPLPKLLLSQYYRSKGYGSNLIYARVIEAELDKAGKLAELHRAAEVSAKKSWEDIQNNLAFFSKHLYQAACSVAPEVFDNPQEVAKALEETEHGELFNAQFLVQTIMDDLREREKQSGKVSRLIFVLDEAGQWIEDDANRLYQLQAFVEEAAIKGRGKIWVIVTTHENMGAIFQNAVSMRPDMKKIEDRFRFSFGLTTENIELVLEDRLFRKSIAGKNEVVRVYNENPGVLRNLGELKSDGQKLPDCSMDRFVTFYPFLPYQIHLIPEIVKSLRSAGGRGEHLSGSTRTLLAISQDILRAGRRKYLSAGTGELVSFDEIYANLSSEGEVSPDARRELSRIAEIVPEATSYTQRVAEVLYLIREMIYIPRTIDNLARLLVETTDDDLPVLIGKVRGELEKLEKAHLVAQIGEEYEFLTGERRTFEEEVAEAKGGLKLPDLQSGLAEIATLDLLGFTTVPYRGHEFDAQILFDDKQINKAGDIRVCVYSPLSATVDVNLVGLEDISLRPDKQQSLFVLCDRVPSFDDNLRYYLAMKEVIGRWKGDPHKSEQARKLAHEREVNDLSKLRDKVVAGIKDGLRRSHVVFQGASRAVYPKQGQTPGEAVREQLATFWPKLYPKYERVPVRLVNEQRAISEVLGGVKSVSSDVQELKLYDKSNQIDLNAPLLDALRVYLSTRKGKNERILGKELIDTFVSPPYGWDSGALRVGIAALVRAGLVKLIIEKKKYSNPADSFLQSAIRDSRAFGRVELELEDTVLEPEVLTEVRKALIAVTGNRKIDETPVAISDAFAAFATEYLQKAQAAIAWARPAELPLPDSFQISVDSLEELMALTTPIHRVKALHTRKDELKAYQSAIRSASDFVIRWGNAFIEMRNFTRAVQPISFRFPTNSSCNVFLQNWDTAEDQSLFTDPNTWKDLQNSRSSAELELEQVKNEWRNEACEKVQKLLDGLAYDHRVKELFSEEARAKAVEPLSKFLIDLSSETRIEYLANAKDRAEKLLQQFERMIAEERQKRQHEGGGGIEDKPVQLIELTAVLETTRISTIQQWEEIRERLDDIINQALESGYNVEFK